ncbi:FAD-dependent oxidoreductase [Salicola sp. Rm-C-2C1-2]|uniref:NAD(P)/FAD-dependent oxidoreductase n=1 Tax=Salicola sp. Rm-C-2C1-2 TaxID=3141321 RepID=UPI0032E4E615
MSNPQRIAVIGSGISGLVCSWLLSRSHEVHLYEAKQELGGHTNTEHVQAAGQYWPVNTGFIVYNDWTYPDFMRIMNRIGVASEPSSMSFSVHGGATGLEYNGTSLNALFAQRSNLINARFLNMVREILRFNRLTRDDLVDDRISADETLGHYLERHRFSQYFRQHYIIPMGAAIWSASESDMDRFPLRFFLRFFNNHGMLSVADRPTWRVIQGGSEAYIPGLVKPLGERVYTQTPVNAITRDNEGVTLTSRRGNEHFDQVIIATHADQALAMLARATDDERHILGALPYQSNDVILHTDTGVLPNNRRAWAAWNYHLPASPDEAVSVTYNMNILQNFRDAPETFCVTLNRAHDIDPARIIKRFSYSHPRFTLEGVDAQNQYERIGGQHRTHYCGAYWFNGFHEDGVQSALRVCEALGETL